MWSAHKHQQGLQVWELEKDNSTDWSGEGHHGFLCLHDTIGRRTFSKWCDVWYLSRCNWHLLVFVTGLIWQPCVLAFCRSESWVGKGLAKDSKNRSNGEKSVKLADTIFVELSFRDETIKLHPLRLFCLCNIYNEGRCMERLIIKIYLGNKISFWNAASTAAVKDFVCVCGF